MNTVQPVVTVILIAVSLLAMPPRRARGDLIEIGDFVSHVETLRNLTFQENSNLYVVPTNADRANFAIAAATLLSGDIMAAEAQAAVIGYEVVRFTDNVSNDVYHGLREVNNTPTRGWGSYFVNLAASQEVLLEVPHPRFDTNSWDIAARSFRDSDARGFLMAGAHRNANGAATADVAHLTDSIFQEAHMAWVGESANRTTYSIHGFNDANHNFPAGIDAVLSSGDGTVGAPVSLLDDQLDTAGFLSYAYNTLDVNDPSNSAVNEMVVGTTFASLGGTTNRQGIYSRGLGGEFVHVEFEQSIRFDANNRIAAAAALTTAMTATVPEPSSISLFGIAIAVTWTRRTISRRRKRGQGPLCWRCPWGI